MLSLAPYRPASLTPSNISPSAPVSAASMNFTILPIRQDKSKLVIYNLDGTTRVVFEVVDGCVMMTEKITSPHPIPGEHRSSPCLHHWRFNIHTLIVDESLKFSTRLDEEQEMMVYDRAVAARMHTIEELVSSLKEQFKDAESRVGSA